MKQEEKTGMLSSPMDKTLSQLFRLDKSAKRKGVFGPSDEGLTLDPTSALQCITVQPGEAMTVQVMGQSGRPRLASLPSRNII
jgi:hypothetical protein